MIETKLNYSNGSVETIYFDPIPHKYYYNDQEISSASVISKQKN